MDRAVFLDRDGVINKALVRQQKPYAPTSLEEFELLPGVPQAIASLKDAGFKIIVVTNQPDVARGTVKKETVDEIHQSLGQQLAVDGIKVCYHVDEDGCSCRKPNSGMLLEAAEEWSLDLPGSYMVGDRWRDIGAGKAAGCRTILVQANYAEPQADSPDAEVQSLLEASKLILANLS